MKKILILLLCLSVLALTGCSAKDEALEKKNPLPQITVACMPSIDKIPIIAGVSLGYFKDHGVDVSIENFQSPTDRNAALQGGTVNAVMSDMVADILYLNSGMEMTMTSLIQTDFAILASPNSGIKTFADITPEHKNGIALNCLMEYIADKAGNGEKIMVPDVMSRIEQLLNNSLDLCIVPEPYGTMAEGRGAVKVGTASDLNIFAGVMLFPKAFAEENPQAVAGFYEGYNDAVKYLQEKGIGDVLEDVTAKGEFPQESQKVLENITFVPLTAPKKEQFEDIQEWMNQHEEFDGPFAYSFEEISNFQYISGIK